MRCFLNLSFPEAKGTACPHSRQWCINKGQELGKTICSQTPDREFNKFWCRKKKKKMFWRSRHQDWDFRTFNCVFITWVSELSKLHSGTNCTYRNHHREANSRAAGHERPPSAVHGLTSYSLTTIWTLEITAAFVMIRVLWEATRYRLEGITASETSACFTIPRTINITEDMNLHSIISEQTHRLFG